jgi:anti-sigma factor RsiW
VSISRQDELLLNAYLDGELDAMDAGRFEQRIAAEPELAAGVDERHALRAAIRSDLADDVPSSDLRRRILADLAPAPPRTRGPWRELAASFLMGAVLAGGLTFAALQNSVDNTVADAVVSNHIRALMAPQPLAAQGFPLVGGRIDIVALKPAATLVYAHGKHLISVTAFPRSEGVAPSLTRAVERGYRALSWSQRGVTYWAVSDAAPGELEKFVKLFGIAVNRS